MAEKLGLDDRVRELKLGSSFNKGGPEAYHSIRYDFKPASVDKSQMATVDVGEGNSITVTVPHVEGSGTSQTVYKGNKRPCQKECILIIDHQTGEITLEKLSCNVHLKKTSSKRCLSRRERSLPLNGQPPANTVATERQHICPNNHSDCDINLGNLQGSYTDVMPEVHVPCDTRTSCKAMCKHGNQFSTGPVLTSQLGRSYSLCDLRRTCDIVSFTQSLDSDIRLYLKDHSLDNSRRPFVSASYGLSLFEREHPMLYSQARDRLELDDDDIDRITNHLCMTYRHDLVKPCNIYGSVQRLEDLVTFVMQKYKNQTGT